MSKRNSFYIWLMAQAKRDDPIGDLAQDVKRDPDAPKYAFRQKTWREHLRSNNAYESALIALDGAFDEFVRYNTNK